MVKFYVMCNFKNHLTRTIRKCSAPTVLNQGAKMDCQVPREKFTTNNCLRNQINNFFISERHCYYKNISLTFFQVYVEAEEEDVEFSPRCIHV